MEVNCALGGFFVDKIVSIIEDATSSDCSPSSYLSSVSPISGYLMGEKKEP